MWRRSATSADLELKDVTAFRFRAKTDNAASIGIQLVDGTGQTHQRQGRATPGRRPVARRGHSSRPRSPAASTGAAPTTASGTAPPRQLVDLAEPPVRPKGKQPVLYLADVRADALLPVFVQPAAFANGFEDAAREHGRPRTGEAARRMDVRGHRCDRRPRSRQGRAEARTVTGRR